jgi:hypothetical protein
VTYGGVTSIIQPYQTECLKEGMSKNEQTNMNQAIAGEKQA